MVSNEGWCLTSVLALCLRGFRSKCVRIVCRVPCTTHGSIGFVLRCCFNVLVCVVWMTILLLVSLDGLVMLCASTVSTSTSFPCCMGAAPLPCWTTAVNVWSLITCAKKTGVSCGINGELDTSGVLALDRASWRAMTAALCILMISSLFILALDIFCCVCVLIYRTTQARSFGASINTTVYTQATFVVCAS